MSGGVPQELLCCCSILRWGGLWLPSLLKSDNPWCQAQQRPWNSKLVKKREKTGLCCLGSGVVGPGLHLSGPISRWEGQSGLWVGPSPDGRASVGCEQGSGSGAEGPLLFVQGLFLIHVSSAWQWILENQSRMREFGCHPVWPPSLTDRETDPEWKSTLWHTTQLVSWRSRAGTQAS